MVNINTVYTTVQAIMNIEQRGYLAPSEFNKYALQAQMEIFEHYFYDLAHFGISRKGMVYDTGYTDLKKLIEEKIDIFATNAALAASSYSTLTQRWTLPLDLYRLNIVYYNDATTTVKVSEMNKKDKIHILNSPLTKPTVQYPKFEKLENEVKIYPISIVTGAEVDYIRTPAIPNWGYSGLGGTRKPLYNSGTSTNFELHIADQYKLVQEILKYAGIQIKEQDIAVAAQTLDQADDQTKKS